MACFFAAMLLSLPPQAPCDLPAQGPPVLLPAIRPAQAPAPPPAAVAHPAPYHPAPAWSVTPRALVAPGRLGAPAWGGGFPGAAFYAGPVCGPGGCR